MIESLDVRGLKSEACLLSTGYKSKFSGRALILILISILKISIMISHGNELRVTN